MISAVCGREFDWELARDLRGWPADRFPMADAPGDGRSIIADWNGIECEAQWDRAWGGGGGLIEKGKPSTPIAPLSWRWPETADLVRAPETQAVEGGE
ncbi:MAG TPA: hypothetical protein VF475_14695 [Sphingobium sp.]